MATVKRILVKSAAGNYAVVCGNGILKKLFEQVEKVGRYSSLHLITSPKVWKALGNRVPSGGRRNAKLQIHKFEDAESAKTLQSLETIARALVQSGADRQAGLLALGGGVVGDVAGFAAASYLRGVALIQIPTTLVAQTDSAIGGKTGVNLPEGKNLLGAFYPPKLVLVDPELLRTLPDREFRSGLAEVIKYGVIADAKLFGFLERNFERLLGREAKVLKQVIWRSIEIKGLVVSRDERESGLREILNFGHTFGHALESATNYKKYLHGEAVAWGMVAAALYGHEIGVTPAADASRIISLVKRMGKLPDWPDVSPKHLEELMTADKKSRQSRLRFFLTSRIGKAATYEACEQAKLEQVLRLTRKVVNTEPVLHG
jgi:3-dehydroquinate synthase